MCEVHFVSGVIFWWSAVIYFLLYHFHSACLVFLYSRLCLGSFPRRPPEPPPGSRYELVLFIVVVEIYTTTAKRARYVILFFKQCDLKSKNWKAQLLTLKKNIRMHLNLKWEMIECNYLNCVKYLKYCVRSKVKVWLGQKVNIPSVMMCFK